MIRQRPRIKKEAKTIVWLLPVHLHFSVHPPPNASKRMKHPCQDSGDSTRGTILSLNLQNSGPRCPGVLLRSTQMRLRRVWSLLFLLNSPQLVLNRSRPFSLHCHLGTALDPELLAIGVLVKATNEKQDGSQPILSPSLPIPLEMSTANTGHQLTKINQQKMNKGFT